MIERQVINGRPATVAYFTKGFLPVRADDAAIAKIMFDDGEIAFATPTVQKFDPNQPRDEAGRWTDAGGGSSGPGVKAVGLEAGKELRDTWAKNAPIQDLDRLIAEAPAMQDALAKVGQEIQNAVGAKFKNPGVKTKSERGIARVKEKMAAGRTASNISDIVRAGFALNDPSQVEGVISGLAKYFEVIDEGWAVTSAGYFDRKVLLKMPNGMLGEIQLMEPSLEWAKSPEGGGGHVLYQRARSLPDGDPVKIALEDQQRALYNSVFDKLSPAWKAEIGKELRQSGK